MKNKLLSILAVSSIMLSLTACSKDPPAVNAPSVSSTPEASLQTEKTHEETAEEGEGVNLEEIAYAEIDRYLTEQTERSDELAIYDFTFKLDTDKNSFELDTDKNIVYGVNRFDAAATFQVNPSNPEEYKKAYPDAKESEYAGSNKLQLFRWFTIEKKGERYEVTGLKAKNDHKAYIAEHLLNAFPDSVPTPDGGSADKTEAVWAYRDNMSNPALKFDFGFLRYASPIFQSSLDDPDSYDFDAMSFKNPYPTETEEPAYFKVRAGDVLECGLTVKYADWHTESNMVLPSIIRCEGEVTWEGILRRFPEADIGIDKGQLYFFPDPLKNEGVPVACQKYWKSEETGKAKADFCSVAISGGGLQSDGGVIDVGNLINTVGEPSEMYDGLFENGNFARVKLTLKNLTFEIGELGSNTYAEVTACEPVK